MLKARLGISVDIVGTELINNCSTPRYLRLGVRKGGQSDEKKMNNDKKLIRGENFFLFFYSRYNTVFRFCQEAEKSAGSVFKYRIRIGSKELRFHGTPRRFTLVRS